LLRKTDKIYTLPRQLWNWIMTDKKQPLENDQLSSPEQKSAPATKTLSPKTDKPKASQVKTNKPMSNKKPTTQYDIKTKISKVAVFALLIALLGIAGSVASYYWFNQQKVILTNDLNTTNQNNNTATQQRVNKLLKQQQSEFSQQLNSMVAKVQKDSEEKLAQLEDAVTRLERNKPSDWLIHEAEYLVRIAARTMWLERDTRAAVGLLKDADSRLAELNDPEFLPVRKLIHQDIEQLQLMPVLNTENVILALMGLNQQLPSLPLLMQQATQNLEDEKSLVLSDDINDWQENLAKTWRNFLDTFVVIHVRDGSAKPLLSPQYQQNLKENLSLKLQQAQWAAREEKSALYLRTLSEVQTWLIDYFDMKDVGNQLFLSSIEQLKSELISFDYPSTLASLSGIRNILADRPIAFKKREKSVIKTTSGNKVVADKEVNKEAVEQPEQPLTIEQQIQKQTIIQEKADEKVQEGEI